MTDNDPIPVHFDGLFPIISIHHGGPLGRPEPDDRDAGGLKNRFAAFIVTRARNILIEERDIMFDGSMKIRTVRVVIAILTIITVAGFVTPGRCDVMDARLIEAVRTGSPADVKRLVEEGANVNARDERFRGTALMWACASGDLDKVAYLLAKGADVDAVSKGGASALMIAILYGYEDAVKALIDRGADVNVKTDFGQTPLMWTAIKNRPESAELLIAHGANIHAEDNNGADALELAKRHGNVKVRDILLKHGAGQGKK